MQWRTQLRPGARALSSSRVELLGDDCISRSGHAGNVLGGARLKASKSLRHPASEPIGQGELVTTGMLTDAISRQVARLLDV
jgi:hypothetical protein